MKCGQGWRVMGSSLSLSRQGKVRGPSVVVDQGSGEGRGVSGGGEARKLLVSCSFNCLDWTCGQPSG